MARIGTKHPQKNTTGKPRQVPADVRDKQESEYSERDFESALDRTTRRLVDRLSRGNTRDGVTAKQLHRLPCNCTY